MVHAGLFRNLGNMNNPALFTYCNVGTKRLVERYTEEVVRQLEFIANEEIEGVTLADKIGPWIVLLEVWAPADKIGPKIFGESVGSGRQSKRS
jgi:hypothetical protein